MSAPLVSELILSEDKAIDSVDARSALLRKRLGVIDPDARVHRLDVEPLPTPEAWSCQAFFTTGVAAATGGEQAEDRGDERRMGDRA